MKIISYNDYIKEYWSMENKRNWIALGNFDGVHRAHIEILKDAVRNAKYYEMTPAVLLFEPHPEIYFNSRKNFLLTTFEEKVDKIKKCGVHLAITKSFDLEFAQKTPYEFAKWIKEDLNTGGVSIGYDYNFGKKRQGTAKDLVAFGRGMEFKTSIVSPVKTREGLPVSSSLCRELLKKGKPALACEYLGEPYRITGQVVKGDGRGRNLGFPTANLSPPNDKLLPCRGVYLVKVKKDKDYYWGVCNIGRRPTFDKEIDTIEIHLINFHEEIYNQNLTLFFIEYVRPERTFSSIEELTGQLNEDIKFARERISEKYQILYNEEFL